MRCPAHLHSSKIQKVQYLIFDIALLLIFGKSSESSNIWLYVHPGNLFGHENKHMGEGGHQWPMPHTGRKFW